ncbi:MAG: ferrous iron transport protein B [Bacteroidota bacterium]|nr:ferrous iron transport protein B [Bacteroidota bacterium]
MPLLGNLKEGEKGIIYKVRGRGAFRRRILEMGFVKGKEVTVVKSAPLMDPVEYQILNYDVSLRRSEANLIEVVTLEEAEKQKASNGFNGVTSTNILKTKAKEKGKIIDVALVGNPNSGKTTLFNIASKSRLHVGNYGGVTVDAHRARFEFNGYTFNITDLPGTYSLTEYSPEEIFVRQHILEKMPDIVINVIDASNLERNLYLTTQLIDLDIKVIAALNMFDELESKGDQFDYKALGKMVGIPFIPTISSKNQGIKELFKKVIDVFEDRDPYVRHVHINYGLDIELAISKLQDLIWKTKSFTDVVSSRFYAIKLLEGDVSATEAISSLDNYQEILYIADREISKINGQYSDDSETLITNAKYGFIEGALKETLVPSTKKLHTRTKKLDHYLTSRFLSYPIFLFFMWFMFEATFFIGQYPMNWIEQLVSLTGDGINRLLPDSIFKDMLIDGIIGGVGGVIVFLPNILLLFMFIAIMEDTGYMSRVAFILDKLMHKVGLHGKSFIPLLMGFGCNVPAILATRTIESKSDRIVTILINPMMSCSARYPVYILIISAFFTNYQGTILFLIYLSGIILAAIMALIFKKTLFRAKDIPFVMELPPYRMPTLRTTLKHTWFRGSQYLKKMGGIIMIASLIIWALGYFPRNQEIPNESTSQKASNQQEQSYIGKIGKFIEPVIRPLGFDWKMGVSLIAGSAAKEIVVSTMGVLYQVDVDSTGVEGLSGKLRKQTYTSGPKKGEKVFTPVAAFSFLAFVLLYLPCIAVIAAVRKETGGWKWAIFMAFYTTGLAWIASFLIYQLGSLLF